MTRVLRRTLRRYGIWLPFRAVICPRHRKAIHIREAAGVEVTIERTLVYLRVPEPADLWDLVPFSESECEIHESPDSQELLRTSTARGTIVHWKPHQPIVPYALYVHTHGWSSPGLLDEAALYTEFRCEAKTGVAVLEVSTTAIFEAAVAFRWPAWRRLWPVHALVKYALEQLDASQGHRPEILDNGSRLHWTLVGPRVGQRYACVAFHREGVALWRTRLSANTLRARMHRLVRSGTFF